MKSNKFHKIFNFVKQFLVTFVWILRHLNKHSCKYGSDVNNVLRNTMFAGFHYLKLGLKIEKRKKKFFLDLTFKKALYIFSLIIHSLINWLQPRVELFYEFVCIKTILSPKTSKF